MTDKATHIELADRIASTLQARMSQFVMPFVVTREINPLRWEELKDDNLRVIVWPAGLVEQRLGVTTGQNPPVEIEATVHVIVFRRFPPTEEDAIASALCRIVEQLYTTFYADGLLMPRGRATLMEVDSDPVYNVDRIKQNIFVSEVKHTWSLVR